MSVLTEDSVRCAGAVCGGLFPADEGWSGFCASCAALSDEHLLGAHADVEGCPHCY